MAASSTLIVFAILLCSAFYSTHAQWMDARAVVYGNPSGSNTYGACYGGASKGQTVGNFTASASAILFSNGTLNDCGACYQVRCVDSSRCKTSSPVTVTVTNRCTDGVNSTNPRCSYPKKQFSLSRPAFYSIVKNEFGSVSIEIKRVTCSRSGPLQVSVSGNPYYISFSFLNVAGSGTLSRVWVRSTGKWIQAKLSWGVQWYVGDHPALRGSSLSFLFQDKLTGKNYTVSNVLPTNWKFGTTYTAGQIYPPPPNPVSSPPTTPISSAWKVASASFTGNKYGSNNYGGCYGTIPQARVLGNHIAAASSALFAQTSSNECGSCYEIKCTSSDYCAASGKTVTVTIGNRCVSSGRQNDRCGINKAHFVLTRPAYGNLAPFISGAIPIQYRRVLCPRAGTIKYYINGNKYWIVAAILNVGGPGSLRGVSIKGTSTPWIPMTNSWGAYWRVSGHPELYGQALSFRLFSRLTNLTLIARNVAPKSWGFNQTYFGGQFSSLY